MDKTIDAWPRRLIYLGIAVLMTLGLLLAPAMTPQASAAEVNAEWDKVGTPYTDDWTVAPESEIVVPATCPGGEVIYVVGRGWGDNEIDYPNFTTEHGQRLWKSDDSGVTWDDLADNVWDADGLPPSFINNTNVSFNYVACARDDSDFVAVAIVDDNGTILDPSDPFDPAFYCDDEQAVVISDDGGDNFAWTGDIDDSSAGSMLTRAFSMTISEEDDDKRNIALGGVGTSNGTCPQGLVFRYETGGLTGGRWVDASDPNVYNGWDNINDTAAVIDSEAVTRVVFAPSWLADNTVLVVSHTNTSTYLQSGTWGNSKVWNEPAGFEPAVLVEDDPSIWPAVRGAAVGLTLPMDYEGRHANNRYAWVYVNERYSPYEGTIYRVTNGAVIDINMQISGKPYLASLAYMGSIDEGKALAGSLGDGFVNMSSSMPFPWSLLEGCCEGVQVYFNDGIADMDICCERWSDSCKPPTGRMSAAVFYVAPNKAYAFVTGVTGFDESAVSFSLDDGDTWNQIGLVDTYIDYLADVAKSPNCNKTWVVSINIYELNSNTAESSSAGAERNGCKLRGACSCFDDEGSYTGYKTCDSVWLKADPLPEASEYSGAWIREWCKELTYEEGLLRLAPEETEDALTVYLVDRGTDTVYYDSNEGLGCWEQGSSTVDDIHDLAVQDEATIYAVGGDAKVAVSDDHGAAASWSSTMDSKVDDGHTIAVLGEGNVLVGGDDGKVAYSDDDLDTFLDGDASFTELDDIGEGDVHVAFDSYFDSNSVIYAAVGDDGDDNGIYRWVIDESTEFTDLGECTGTATPSETQIGLDTSCDPVEVGYYGIVLSYAEGNPETDATTGGVLYAAYAWDENGTYYTGVARCLNPAEEVACGEAMWDYLIQGVAEDAAFIAEPSSLKICGCLTPDTNSKLWAIDWNWYYYGGYYCDPYFATDDEESSQGRLWTYEDCFAKAAPTILSPATDAVVDADPCYCWNDAFTLKWDRQCDACSYNLQISLDEDFTEVILDISGKDDDDCTEIDYDPPKGSAPSYVVENMALGTGSCGTTFYWRVRSADAETDEIIHSPWSEVRSFTVAVGPMAQLTLTNPSNGAIGVAVSNIPFTWDAVADATGYEFSLMNAATDAEVVSASVSGTTYTYTGTLSYDTAYYWTVEAMKDTTVFGDATATFTTGAEGVVPPEPTTPAWVWVIIAIGAILVIVTLVLIFRTRRV